MKRGEKAGQFYLIAAIIISVILIGFVSMVNYSKRQESISLQNIGEELKIESENVFDFGTYKGYDESQMQGLAGDFIDDYINYNDDKKDSYFLFGNTNNIKVFGYSESDKIIYVDAGSGYVEMSITAGEISSHEFTPAGNDIIIKIDEKDYEFKLKSGENFYFVILDNIKGEEHVVRN